MPSSRMWRIVDLVWTDVSEERIASVFRVEKSVSEEEAWAGGCRRLFLELFYACYHDDFYVEYLHTKFCRIYTPPPKGIL
jgi:hypothetical protein